MKVSTKLLWVALPPFFVVTFIALLFLGGVPQIGGLPDLIAYVIELAPKTVYAIAIGGATAFAMNVTGMDLGTNQRHRLIEDAAVGHLGPMRVLQLETVSWFGWMVLWIVVFKLH